MRTRTPLAHYLLFRGLVPAERVLLILIPMMTMHYIMHFNAAPRLTPDESRDRFSIGQYTPVHGVIYAQECHKDMAVRQGIKLS